MAGHKGGSSPSSLRLDLASGSVMAGTADKAMILLDQNGMTMRDHAQRQLFSLLETGNDDLVDNDMFHFTLSSVITQARQRDASMELREQFSTVPRLQFGGSGSGDFLISDSGEEIVHSSVEV